MGSKGNTEALRFVLNPMDNVMPRFYANFILTFGLQPGVDFYEVHQLLQASIHSVADELPIIRRRVFEIPRGKGTSSTAKGSLEARERPEWVPQVLYNDLSATWPHYDDLMEEGLPQDVLDGEQLVPSVHTKWDLTDRGADGCILQANFIEGGLLLSVSLFHSLVDGMSGSLLLKMWARCMRQHQGDNTDATNFTVAPASNDLNLVPDAWTRAGNSIPSPQQFREGSDEAWRLLGMLPPLLPEEVKKQTAFSLDPTISKAAPEMKTTIFYVSAESFVAMTAAAKESVSEPSVLETGITPASSPPTANDALMALLWRCTMKARVTAEPQNPAYTTPGVLSELDTTLDGRLLFSDRLPWSYMGTLVFIATTRMPVSTLTSPNTSLATVALTVRRAVEKITKERLHESYGLAAAMRDFGEARYPFATFEGAEACFTSFLGLPLMEMRFGKKVFRNGGLVDHLRPPRREFDIVCRRCVVLPPRPAGGFEIMLSLKETEMDILENDPEFGKFAQVLCH